MKVRRDFVTNSSSSCYIVACYEILNKEGLEAFLKEEYGKLGAKIMKDYIAKGETVKEDCEYLPRRDWADVSEEEINAIEDDKEYLYIYSSADIPGVEALAVFDLPINDATKALFYASFVGMDG